MVLVYRVEDDKQVGPYRSDVRSKHCEKARDIAYNMGLLKNQIHPSPYCDNVDFTSEHRFGFSNLKQMHDWFGGAHRPLARYGFKVAAYDVAPEDISIGGKQIAFRFDRAQPIWKKRFGQIKWKKEISK